MLFQPIEESDAMSMESRLKAGSNPTRMAILTARLVRCAALLLAAALVAGGADAQEAWPRKPLVVISPAPGTSGDFVPRIIYEQVARDLGTSLVVEYRQGLGGTLALEAVARSAPDGYTLGIPSQGSLGIATTMQAKALRYDPLKDFVGVARLVSTGNVLVVNKDLPVKSLQELVAYAKARPGKLNFGAIAGFGTSFHLAWVLFSKKSGIDVVQVPFKGAADAIQATIGGDIQIIMSNTNTLLPAIQGGRMKALAVTTATRETALPDVPTMMEAGMPDFEASSWFGTVVRTGTPQPIVDRLSAATLKVLRDPDVVAKLQKIGLAPYPQGGKEFDAFFRAEIALWGQVVRDSDFKTE